MQPRLARALVRCAALLPLLALGGLGACQSRLTGSKTRDYDLPRGSVSGIPFRLARPVFVVRRIVDTAAEPANRKPDKFQLSVEYRSDPTAVYWINADPAEFHKSHLTLSFSRNAADAMADDPKSHGFLSGVLEEGGDQSKGFFEAIGKFATDAIGLYVLSEGNARDDAGRTGAGAGLLAVGNLLQPTTTGDFSPLAAPWLDALKLRLEGLDLPEPLRSLGPKALPMALGPRSGQSKSIAEALERIREGVAEQLRKDLKEFWDLTGFDLRRLHQLFDDQPLVAPLVREALGAMRVLPGQDAKALAAVVMRLDAVYAAAKPKGGFSLDDHRTASLQAYLELQSMYRFLDRLAERTQPSPALVDVERRCFAAAGMHAAWDERRRLEAFLESAQSLYEPGSPSAPDVGFVAELERAARRVADIGKELAQKVEAVLLRKDPSEPVVTQVTPKPRGEAWEGTADEFQRPRWVYQACVPGAEADRAAWLEQHLRRVNPGAEPAAIDEFVVLVERSYPDREVQLDPRIVLGQVVELQPSGHLEETSR